MSEPVDLLLITWNRREYVKKTLDNLLNDPADFRLYCWDNGSKDGAADIVAAFKDDRIIERHYCPINIMQAFPAVWFLERSCSNIIGKVDDDTLVPKGWIKTLSDAIRNFEKLGMIGCWTFWQDDFERNREKAVKKIIEVGNHQIIHNTHIGGTAFLMRKEMANKYLEPNHHGRGFPIDRIKMTKDGYISGWYFPIVWAEHMDDPRSKHCLMKQPGGMKTQAALTAKTRNIKTLEQYQDWIMRDADMILCSTVNQQLKKSLKENKFYYKLKKKIIARLRKNS